MNATLGVSIVFLIGAVAGYYGFKHYRQTGGLF